MEFSDCNVLESPTKKKQIKILWNEKKTKCKNEREWISEYESVFSLCVSVWVCGSALNGITNPQIQFSRFLGAHQPHSYKHTHTQQKSWPIFPCLRFSTKWLSVFLWVQYCYVASTINKDDSSCMNRTHPSVISECEQKKQKKINNNTHTCSESALYVYSFFCSESALPLAVCILKVCLVCLCTCAIFPCWFVIRAMVKGIVNERHIEFMHHFFRR